MDGWQVTWKLKGEFLSHLGSLLITLPIKSKSSLLIT